MAVGTEEEMEIPASTATAEVARTSHSIATSVDSTTSTTTLITIGSWTMAAETITATTVAVNTLFTCEECPTTVERAMFNTSLNPWSSSIVKFFTTTTVSVGHRFVRMREITDYYNLKVVTLVKLMLISGTLPTLKKPWKSTRKRWVLDTLSCLPRATKDEEEEVEDSKQK